MFLKQRKPLPGLGGYMRIGISVVLGCLVSSPALAQVDQVITAPQNLVLSNYNSVPVGPYGGLEGAAFSARVGDPSAAWFNPAGLARQESAQISGSAGVYQLTSVSTVSLPSQGGSIQQLPNYVGFTFSPRTGLTVGAALVSTNAWNQETDAEFFSTVATGQQRFAYSADSEFNQRVAAISAGYYGGGRWRFGGGLAFSLMDLRLVQIASDRIATASALQTVLVSARASGSAFQLRAQAGAQYDVSGWRFGGAMRTPGLNLMRSASVTLDGVLDPGTGGAGSSLFDSDAHMEYHLPWEFQGGAALVRKRFEIEVDVQAFTPISGYSMISTTNPVLVYTDAGNGTAPSVASRPFGGLNTASDGVVNVGAGGHVQLVERRKLLLHGGVGSNRSPVGSGDNIFNKVDLTIWSIGLSGTFGKFQFAAGVNRQGGRADDVTLRNLLNGQTVTSAIDVHTTGLIYSLAYQF
jgi:hypothetical protein